MVLERLRSNDRMSQIVIHGNTVYLAGQVASGKAGASVADQTRNILETIDLYLAEAGTDKSKLLQATIWLSNMASFEEMNNIWDDWIPDSRAPCRACVEAKLANDKFQVEIMVVAGL